MIRPHSFINPIIPCRGYCLITSIDEQKKTTGGLILPDSLQEKQAKGKILAIGLEPFLPNGQTVKWEVKIGDVVWFKRFGGEEAIEAEKKYIFVPSNALLGKVILYD